jgi:hypothetical protein
MEALPTCSGTLPGNSHIREAAPKKRMRGQVCCLPTWGQEKSPYEHHDRLIQNLGG